MKNEIFVRLSLLIYRKSFRIRKEVVSSTRSVLILRMSHKINRNSSSSRKINRRIHHARLNWTNLQLYQLDWIRILMRCRSFIDMKTSTVIERNSIFHWLKRSFLSTSFNIDRCPIESTSLLIMPIGLVFSSFLIRLTASFFSDGFFFLFSLKIVFVLRLTSRNSKLIDDRSLVFRRTEIHSFR